MQRLIDLKKVYNFAEEIREKIGLEMGNDDMMGLCCYASKKLRLLLRIEGIRSKLIGGTFAIDSPNLEYIDAEYHDYKRIFFPSHYWLEINSLIIDITADQFNDELIDDEMNEIVIETYENSPRYLKSSMGII